MPVQNSKLLSAVPNCLLVISHRIERSTDQVIKPVNMEALTKWLGHIPADVLQDMGHIAPMLSRLGYDPYANPPNYGNPDPLVINNTHRVSATVSILYCWFGAKMFTKELWAAYAVCISPLSLATTL